MVFKKYFFLEKPPLEILIGFLLKQTNRLVPMDGSSRQFVPFVLFAVQDSIPECPL